MGAAFGKPTRSTKKVMAWDLAPDVGVVLQIDQPAGGSLAYIWAPYPREGQTVPEIALEYAAETGRHSNTYASPGLQRGKAALKLRIHDRGELDQTVGYLRAMAAAGPLPEVVATADEAETRAAPARADPASFGTAAPRKPRREAIPRAVQREVWQRDGGACVECGDRALLCFDHIVPLSKGGANTVRNIQLLCEGCNLSKGNRI